MGALLSKLRGGGGRDGSDRDRVVAYRDGEISPASRGVESGKLDYSSSEYEDDEGSEYDVASSVASSHHVASSGRADALPAGAAWEGVPLSSVQPGSARQSSVDGTSPPGTASALSSARSTARSSAGSVGGRAAGRFAPGFGRGVGRGGGRGGGRWSRASRARIKQGLPPLPDDREAPRLSAARQGQTGAALVDLINHGVAVLTPEPEPEPDESSDSELEELQCEVDRFEEMAKRQAEALARHNPLSDPACHRQRAS